MRCCPEREPERHERYDRERYAKRGKQETRRREQHQKPREGEGWHVKTPFAQIVCA